jgi:RNA polymerase sigma factor (sigma-70 family)
MWMDQALKSEWPTAKQDRRLSEAISRARVRLWKFIRKRVADQADAEDILQDVFYELMGTYRLIKPIEELSAWLFRVARNRMIDLFRRQQREALRGAPIVSVRNEDETFSLEEFLPSPDDGSAAIYARSILLEELERAFDELPEEQREVFIAHELMGYSFKEMAEQTGASLSALLSRKHRAVLHLRERLQSVYDDFKDLRGE